MNAREEILARVRTALEGVKPPPRPVGPSPGLPLRPAGAEEQSACFEARLRAVGGTLHRVQSADAALTALLAIAAGLGARELAHSDDPLVVDLARRAAALDGLSAFDGSRDRARLLRCPLGLTGAQLGIAETGSLVLCSSDERHRETSLVPEVHVALLRRSRLVATLGEALERAYAGAAPALVTLITGPSRTADIELTLVVGVHGPRALHVLLLDDGPSPA